MNYLSSIEKEVLDVLEDINFFFDSIKVTRYQRIPYRELRGKIRDLIVKLENRRFGCPTGRHSAACRCHTETP